MSLRQLPIYVLFVLAMLMTITTMGTIAVPVVAVYSKMYAVALVAIAMDVATIGWTKHAVGQMLKT